MNIQGNLKPAHVIPRCGREYCQESYCHHVKCSIRRRILETAVSTKECRQVWVPAILTGSLTHTMLTHSLTWASQLPGYWGTAAKVFQFVVPFVSGSAAIFSGMKLHGRLCVQSKTLAEKSAAEQFMAFKSKYWNLPLLNEDAIRDLVELYGGKSQREVMRRANCRQLVYLKKYLSEEEFWSGMDLKQSSSSDFSRLSKGLESVRKMDTQQFVRHLEHPDVKVYLDKDRDYLLLALATAKDDVRQSEDVAAKVRELAATYFPRFDLQVDRPITQSLEEWSAREFVAGLR